MCRLCVGGKKMPLLQRLLHVPCATACPLRTAVECVLCAMANLQPMLGPVMGHSPLGPRMGGVWVGCPPFLSWVLFMVGQSLAHMLSLCRLAGPPPVWGLV